MRDHWLVVALVTAARRTARDRGPLAVSLLFYAIVAAVLATLWRTAADANGGSVAGYTALQLCWYAVMAEAVVTAPNPRLIEQIGDDIASGAVAADLLRPAPVFAIRLAGELGRCLPRLTASFVVGLVLATAMEGAPPHVGALALVVPSMLLAATCNLAAQHACAAAAFWVRDSRSAWFLYQKLVFVLGGMLLPLEAMPDALERVARLLPFMAMAYVPARLASGAFEPQLLLVQAFWLAVVVAGAYAVFARGERRIQVVGG